MQAVWRQRLMKPAGDDAHVVRERLLAQRALDGAPRRSEIAQPPVPAAAPRQRVRWRGAVPTILRLSARQPLKRVCRPEHAVRRQVVQDPRQ